MPGPLTSRRGDWFISLKGRQIYPYDLHPEDIDIEEIAQALGNLCRFGGHLREFYSVAQHSALVASVLPPELRLCGLLHDATEAYCGDMVRPLKRSPGMAAYRELEGAIWSVIAARFDLPAEILPEVKEADNRMLITERRDLVAPHPWRWTLEEEQVQPYGFEIVPMEPRLATTGFLAVATALGLAGDPKSRQRPSEPRSPLPPYLKAAHPEIGGSAPQLGAASGLLAPILGPREQSFSVEQVNARCSQEHTFPRGGAACWCGRRTRRLEEAAAEVRPAAG